MAISGGYYLLSMGDKVYVNPHSTIGSVGIIHNLVNYKGLVENYNT